MTTEPVPLGAQRRAFGGHVVWLMKFLHAHHEARPAASGRWCGAGTPRPSSAGLARGGPRTNRAARHALRDAGHRYADTSATRPGWRWPRGSTPWRPCCSRTWTARSATRCPWSRRASTQRRWHEVDRPGHQATSPGAAGDGPGSLGARRDDAEDGMTWSVHTAPWLMRAVIPRRLRREVQAGRPRSGPPLRTRTRRRQPSETRERQPAESASTPLPLLATAAQPSDPDRVSPMRLCCCSPTRGLGRHRMRDVAGAAGVSQSRLSTPNSGPRRSVDGPSHRRRRGRTTP